MLPRLKQLRESKFLTQRELSSGSGVAVSTIVRLEKCQQKPNFSTIKRLSAALGVRPDELTATSHDVLETEKESAPVGEPLEAAAALRSRWGKTPDERSMVDAFLADRKEQALRETEETAGRLHRSI